MNEQTNTNKKLIIDGWRGVHHSFAMLNQHQILALLRRGDVSLAHNDMPLLMAHWNSKDHNPGFNDDDYQRILALKPSNESQKDCVYRICAPMHPPAKEACRTITFGITELGFSSSSLLHPQQPISDITAGDNLIVTSTRWSRDRLIDFGFPDDKVHVVTCGVDLKTFTPLSAEEALSQRTALQIPLDAVVFLNIGVPTWNKGLDLLLRAFAATHKRYPNTRLILKDARGLYGLPIDSVLSDIQRTYPGLLTPATLAAISVIPSNLTQSQIRSLYGLADWYVSPYRAEGFNLPVLEAQACGTPVITSSGGATDDFCNTSGVRKIASVFKRGHLGQDTESCWVEPYFQALEELMLQAASEGPLSNSGLDPHRKAARDNAEKYSWDRVADDLVSVIWS